MRKFFCIIWFFLSFITIKAQYQGPVPSIIEGYGADGEHSVSVVSFESPLWKERNVDVFYPGEITEPVPVIFFSHGYGGNDTTNYLSLLKHIASVGYAVVFSPYKTILSSNEERYNTLFEGFNKAVKDYSNIIDSTKVGFVGHSFGGGAIPEMAR